MIEEITKEEWEQLPVQAQREVRDFFLFIREKYTKKDTIKTNKKKRIFEAKIPSKSTLQAMVEIKEGQVKRFSSVDDLMADLHAKD